MSNNVSGISMRLEEPARNTIWVSWTKISKGYVHPTYSSGKNKGKVKYRFKEYSLEWTYKVPGVNRAYGPVYASVTDWTATSTTYSVPSNASSVSLRMKAVYTKEKASSCPTPGWVSGGTITVGAADYVPAQPSAPTTTLDENNNVTIRLAEVSQAEIDKGVNQVGFSLIQYYRDENGVEKEARQGGTWVDLDRNSRMASWITTLDAGYYYRFAAYTKTSLGYTSPRSNWTSDVYAHAARPTSFSVTLENSTSVRLWFDVVGYVEEYEVQWATKKEYLDTPELITTSGVSQSATWTEEDRTSMVHRVRHVVQDLSSGNNYWFRVMAKSGSFGTSLWSDVYMLSIGKVPGPPSTYSSKTSAMLGEEVNLYWVHNTQDGSNQTNAQIALYANLNVTDDYLLGGTYIDVPNPWLDDLDETNDNRTVFYPLRLTTIGNYTVMDGDTIRWKVRTKGVYTEGTNDATETFDIVSPSSKSNTSTVSVTLQNNPIINTSTMRVIMYRNGYSSGIRLSSTANEYSISGKTLTVDFNQIEKIIIRPETLFRLRVIYTYGNEGYGDWSELRSISVYSKPTASLSLRTGWTIDPENPTDIEPIHEADPVNSITQYPIGVIMHATPDSQKVISYNLTITNAGDEYETNNMYGEPVKVGPNEIVYQKYFDVDTDNENTNTKTIILYPSDITLQDGQSYNFKLEAYMESGLSDEDILENISVSLADADFYTMAYVHTYPSRFEATIRPFCYDEDYDQSTEIDDDSDSDIVNAEYLTENVVLDVYRLETDGTFTLLRPNIPNDGSSITDSHPALDYARYRIVARKTTTAAAAYADIEAEMGVHSLVIQWNDTWANYPVNNAMLAIDNFDDEDDAFAIPIYQQGILVLPWNIDTTEDYKSDVSLVEYIGREHPVSYYGTQKGQTASWSTDIDKQDADTLFRLRRLSRFMGDCYVREPSGTGYWANVQVNWSQTHNEPAIPVSISVTRVEGIPEYNPNRN